MALDDGVDSPARTRRTTAHAALKDAYDRGGMTLVVQGMAGMGKTRLLREISDAARDDRRWGVAYISADEFERHEPYGFLERLLAEQNLPLQDWDLLSDLQVQPISVARRLLRQANAAGLGELVIVIDDAQWVDPESALVLRYLLPRLTQRQIFAVFGVRTPHQPGSFGEQLAQISEQSSRVRLLTVEPLTAEEIRAFAGERLGQGISPRTAEYLLNATGGSFLHVASIIEHLTPAEIARLHLTWDIPLRGVRSTKNPLLIGYENLSDAAKATTEIVCLIGNEVTRVDLADTARRLGEGLCLDEALETGVLTESGFGSTIMPTHALVAHAVRDAIAPERVRQVCHVLAERSEGFRSIRYALAAAERLDAGLLAQVRAYVAEAAEANAFANINTVLRTTLELVGTDDTELREDLLITLGLANLRNKSVYLLLDLYQDYQRLTPSMVTDLLAVALAAYHPEVAFPQERVMAMLGRPPADADEIAVQAYLAFLLVIMNMRTSDYSLVAMLQAQAQAKAMQAHVPDDPAALRDPRLAWLVDPVGYTVLIECLEVVELHRHYDMEATLSAISQLQRKTRALPDGPTKADAITVLAGAAGHAGMISQAKELAETANGLLERVPKPWMAGTTWMVLADCRILLGELREAKGFLDIVQELHHDAADLESRPMTTALQAAVAAITASPGADALARQALVLHEFTWEGYGPDFAVLAQCEVARVRREPEAILQAIESAPVDTMVNTRRGFLTFRVHALLDLGRIDEAAELIETLEEWRGTRWHECWGTLAWLRARLAESRDEPTAAARLYREAIAVTEFPLPLALTLVDHAGLLAGAGELGAARTQLLKARSLLERIGAKGYLPRVNTALGGLEAVSRDELASLLAELTQREREIAEHLANGWSNQQIAEALVVSTATVRFHVSNVLRKLRLVSRAEVGPVLRGHQTASPPAPDAEAPRHP